MKDFNRLSNDVRLDLKHIDDKLNQESSDLHKLKVTAKETVSRELAKLQDFNEVANYEFQRMNTFIRCCHTMLNLIMED